MKALKAKASILALAAPFALAACGDSAEPAGEATMDPAAAETAEAQTATAELKDTEGNVVGNVTVTGEDGALMVEVNAMNMPAGMHGAHIHETGDCSAGDFASAGGHWNPDNKNHGPNSEPPNPHAGDIGNIEIAEDGTGTLSNTSSGTWAGLMDADGSAFVVHADADDKESQPSGNAGARIACGVFVSS
ncbi:superoxide dismutase family protein [Croceicoccus sediminis]|uniref:superoxide dismutase family protein n=1 Tax=Croceicoccus sediminis TaxID=2571150 RepID=UPI00118452FF|nr:superoxide dismutase family protein [Croceicoccus sediminis]